MNRFMSIIFAILGLILCNITKAESIKGRIVDDASQPIAFANVILLNHQDSSFIQGTVSKNDGSFVINAEYSEELLKVSAVGYKTEFQKIKLGETVTIQLQPETYSIKDVVVKGKRPVIKMNRGKMQVNVLHTMLAHTGDALQVLSMLPFISRTEEGVSVFGRGTPLVYLDNVKINDIGELQKLSSDEVKHVEVDLHPSASYGNEIRAVIRIITVRKGEGFSTSFTAQGNQTKHFNYSGVGKLNYRFKQWDLFGGMDCQNAEKENLTGNSTIFQHNGNAINIDQSLRNNIHNKSFNANVGFNFSNKGKNELGMKYNLSRKPSCKDELSGNSVCAENYSINDSEDVRLLDVNEKTTHTLNAYYLTSWRKDCRFALTVDYLHGKTESQYESFWTQRKNVDTENQSNYHLYTGKAEMYSPFWGGELHYGVEISYTNNAYSYHAGQVTNAALNESEDENRQKLWGLFVSQSKTLGDFSIEAGGRIEIADYQYLHDGKLNEEVSKNYKKLLPYLQIDFDKNDVSMSLCYRNAIHRPSYGQLNGSTVYVDKYTYQKGNPLLLSAYDYIIDYVFSWKDLMIDVSHTWYENSIMKTTQKIPDIPAILFTSENIPHYREWSATVSYSPKIGFWNPKAEVSLFRQMLSYNGIRYNTPYFSYELNNIFKLSKHMNLTINMWGTAAGNLYLSCFKPSFRTDIGLNSYLLQNKLAVWIKISDLFDSDKERWSSNVNNILFSKNRKLYTQGVMVQLRYSFNPQRSKYKGTATSSEILRF